MAEANEFEQAKTVYSDLCSYLDERGWHYQRFDDELIITFKVNGDDIPMDFVLNVDDDRQLLRVYSRLPFTVPEDKRMELAIATTAATYRFIDGSFDYNIGTGEITFRMTASFRESKIGKGLFEYLIDCSCSTVDEYNDKFLLLCKGLISVEDFIAKK